MRDQGIYKNVPIELYHTEEGISSSGINLILDCPRRYHYEYHEKKREQKGTDYKIGQAFHALLLEPERFNEAYYCMEDSVDLRTKVGKETMERAQINANGREILRIDDTFLIMEMAKSARQHPVWQHIQDGQVEQSIYWNAGIYNTRLRSRPDIFNETLIIDVKTTESIQGFQRSLYQYGYHRQAAMQIDALKHFNEDGSKRERFFAFFVVEKKAPYLTACFTLDMASLAQGRKEYLDGAATYFECLKADKWPGYDEKFQLASIPKWAIKMDQI